MRFHHLIKTLFGLSLLVLLFANQSMAQSPTFLEPCARGKEPPAEFGPQEPTLCQRYSSNSSEPLPLSIQIGSPGRQLASQIVALIGSNQLSGNVSVVGNFTIDVGFSFVNAVCSINPNVQILVQSDINLSLNNAKLFCCNGFWRGIFLAYDGDIMSQNVTEIEDALIAIDVPCSSSKVSIQGTIFNRNVIGINIGRQSMLSAPCSPNPNSLQFDLFSGNTFQCTSHLNGSQNGVGLCGIRVLGHTVLHIGAISSALSYFRQIRFGIYAPLGSETILIVNKCRFENLLHTGIFQSSGDLNIFQSRFTNCYANGIRQDFTRNLTVKTCWFVYNADLDDVDDDAHNGIYATQFGIGAQVSISYSHFEFSYASEGGIGTGINLIPGFVGLSTKSEIDISYNEFQIQTTRCDGINLEGDFLNLVPGSSRIFNNNFSLLSPNSEGSLDPIFITGEFRNFSITDNDFFGLQGDTLSINRCLYLYGHGNSVYNVIANNIWHLPEGQSTLHELLDLDFYIGIEIDEQDSASICYNQFYNLRNVGNLGNLGLETVFSNNIFAWMANGPNISAGEIGLQEHEGNRWTFPAVELNGLFYIVDIVPSLGCHIRCTPDPINSRFFVHTPQATDTFDVWHPFYPLDVEPEENFFFQEAGTPHECNLPGFGGDVPDLYKWLADGNTAALNYMSNAELWRQQRRLYRLLKTNATFYASYSGFPAFVAQHQNGSVGKFYQIHSLLSQSSMATVALSSVALSQQQILHNNIAEIAYLDSLLETETSSVTIASLKAAQATAAAEIVFAQSELEDLQEQYEAPRVSYYQQAQIVNSTVNASAIYEVNEKAFNQVLLNSLINQSGNLTEQDAQTLSSIASQCPKAGGIAVIKARSLLEDCYEGATNDYTPECLGEFSTQSQVNFRVVSSERNQLKTHTSVVVGEDIFLDILFVEGSHYSLYDLNGRELSSGKLDASLRVQIPARLANGVYFCKVTYPSGKVVTQKVVISR